MARRVNNESGRALPTRPPLYGWSAEADPRTIGMARDRARRRAVAKVLASMLDVGIDADFERVDSIGGFPRKFD
jgi:hypothetical protein